MVKAGNMLRRKLWRDMWKSRMQFMAIVLLCALGTWVFSGLDAAWRMLDVSVDKYFTEQNLGEFWVGVPSADRETRQRIATLDGVSDVQARVSLEMDTTLESGATVQMHAYDGVARINVPLARQGEALSGSDLRGCMLEEQFAKAQGLRVGDRLTLKKGALEETFLIRALVLSPEHVITAKDVVADPAQYGFVILNRDAVALLPQNELVVKLAPGADVAGVKRAIEAALPSALVVDHTAHSSTQRTQNDVTMFRNLSYVFPLLAFAVAAMIVLTTITRMIENQRIQMGTLKSLGYHDAQITRHYLSYAFYPSLAGALLGLAVGQVTLPYILWDMEAANYVLPYRIHAPVSGLSWAVCALGVLLACLMCLLAYRKSAKEVTAALLRPKPPKAGSRLLLERMGGLWRHLGFNSKMVVRNLLRSKGRTAMSLVGILCCTMLIITSLGLQDSVRYFVGNYYHGTLGYDLRADLDAGAGEMQAYRQRLSAERVEGVMEKTVSLRTSQKSRTTLLTVIEDDQRLLNLGKNETYVVFPPGGVVVTQKIANVMHVDVGDELEIWLAGDDESVTLPVTYIAQVDIGQGAYMLQSDWAALRKGLFTPTALLLKAPTAACLRILDTMDEQSAMKWPEHEYEQTLSILQSMMGVFMLMSGAALGLAFVILYNMGILNFMERCREYATLKVLGYHQKEIRGLMIRENNIVSVLGVLLGIGPGWWLTGVVLHSCESEEMVFASTVEPVSVLIACTVTLAFSFALQLFLTRSVKKIDMVEALKSVE